MDFLPSRSGERDGVEVIVRVQKECLEKVLRGSGEFGVFSPPLLARGEPRTYKDVQLPKGFDLQACLRKAKAIGPTILGVSGTGDSDCEPKRATSRKWLVRFTQQRKPGGSWETGGCLFPGARQRCRRSCRVGLAWWRRLTEQGRRGAPLLGQQCLLSTTDCSTFAQRSHENVKCRAGPCVGKT